MSEAFFKNLKNGREEGIVRILVLSDTHIPKSAPDLPTQVYEDMEKADVIFHAGDFVEMGLLDKLRSIKKTTAVYGNMDSVDVRNTLNPKEVVKIGGYKIGLIHGYGPPADLIETVKKEFGKVDAIVFGHSHSATNMVKDGILFFNPGSPTDKVFSRYNSYGVLKITNDKIEGEIIKL